jgi:hypothetical protein
MAEKNDSSKNKIDKAPLNDKLADIFLKVLMTGGVAGGGFGAFWSLFKDSDIYTQGDRICGDWARHFLRCKATSTDQ